MIPTYIKPHIRTLRDVVLERHSAPDEKGRVTFTLYWGTTYIPGHPDGEESKDGNLLIRGQVFFQNPDSIHSQYQEKGISIVDLGVVQ